MTKLRIAITLLLIVHSVNGQNPAPTGGFCSVKGDIGRVWVQRNTASQASIIYACQNVGGDPILEQFTPNKWAKYSITKTASGWSVNGGTSVAHEAATLQAISIFTGTDAYVDAVRLKTTTACAGVSTLIVSDIGTTVNVGQYTGTSISYDLKAAVATTNISWPVLAALPPTTSSGANTTVLVVQSTGGNVSAVTTGCAFDAHVRWNTLNGL